MILFVTGQYAGGQYIYPLISKWDISGKKNYLLVATNASCKFWDEHGISYINLKNITDSQVATFLEKNKPNLVVVSASACLELEYQFIKEAKRKKIPTVSYIDIWTNYRARFNNQGKIIYPDTVFAIDERCAEEMCEAGIPDNIVHIIGQPYLESICRNIPENGKNLLIASQPVSKFHKQTLGYDESSFRAVCISAVKELKLDSVHVTTHPDEKIIDVKKVKNITFSAGKGLVDVAESHTVLGMFSMQMIIGYLWGRKVASIQPGLLTQDPSPLSRWGLIPRLGTVDEVKEFIKDTCVDYKENILKEKLIGSTERFENFCLNYQI